MEDKLLTWDEVPLGRIYESVYHPKIKEIYPAILTPGYKHPTSPPFIFKKITDTDVLKVDTGVIYSVFRPKAMTKDIQFAALPCRRLLPTPKMSDEEKTQLLNRLPSRIEKVK